METQSAFAYGTETESGGTSPPAGFLLLLPVGFALVIERLNAIEALTAFPSTIETAPLF